MLWKEKNLIISERPRIEQPSSESSSGDRSNSQGVLIAQFLPPFHENIKKLRVNRKTAKRVLQFSLFLY